MQLQHNLNIKQYYWFATAENSHSTKSPSCLSTINHNGKMWALMTWVWNTVDDNWQIECVAKHFNKQTQNGASVYLFVHPALREMTDDIYMTHYNAKSFRHSFRDIYGGGLFRHMANSNTIWRSICICTFNFSRQKPNWTHFINDIVVHTRFVCQIISVEWYYKLEISHHEISSSAFGMQYTRLLQNRQTKTVSLSKPTVKNWAEHSSHTGWVHVSIRKKDNTFSNLYFLIRTSLRTELD